MAQGTRLINLFIMALALGLAVAPARSTAGILFEPYAGYSIGDVSRQTVLEQSTGGDADGFTYGGRLAWTFGRFFIGGEFQGLRGSIQADEGSTSHNWNTSAIYGIMGLQFFSGLRLIGGINVQPIQIEESTSPDRTKYWASAMKIGLGYQYRTPIALNIEYIDYNLTKQESGSDELPISDYYNKFDYSVFMLSISFPFLVGDR